MSYDATSQAILGQFDTAFASAEPTVEIAYPNVPYAATHGTPFVRVTINWGNQRPASVGGANNIYRTVGVVQVQVFADEGTGPREALGIADNVVASLRGLTVSGVRLKGTTLQTIGARRGWYQINATTPFEFDAT